MSGEDQATDTNIGADGEGCWWVYLLRCADDSLYTGITTDLQRRLDEHNQSVSGARYTRSRRPVELVYREVAGSRAEASRREAQIKRLTRKQKLDLISRAGD